MKVESIHIKNIDVKNILKKSTTVIHKNKRERMVFEDGGLFYKLWVSNWSQGDITEYAFNTGYYDEFNCTAILNLIHDDEGPRGYIMNSGETFKNNWQDFCNKTTYKQRYDFMMSLLENSKNSKGIYADLFPTNMIVFDGKINLIDLDSFNSFSFIFDKKKMPYEKFDLDAWWKPHESICKGFKDYYKQYFSICLKKNIDFEIKDIESIDKMINLLKES